MQILLCSRATVTHRELLGSLTSVEDIDKRMAELSGEGKIDPAFLQISAKAYGAARDTNMTLDEVYICVLCVYFYVYVYVCECVCVCVCVCVCTRVQYECVSVFCF